ncbi:four helix bundle protein [Pseudomarimonas salicorniae]|uniref:Four helix bundle protein n=1 Tax=Pseudomarimonas salicorniae TaxID=2933270 RepID=A0ABT0GF31_9GAMM|nr:four helix bundle protein [Lysobacter sp. CAU 1642]MCK7593154.1 four helix bundle protein [Lysobacter sp. CAU 1642]
MATHFEQLIAWQKAMDLAEQTYALTATWPPHERFGLSSQAQRAAVSVPANIAEGHERRSRKEYRRFLAISAGSLAELETHLRLGVRIGISETSRTDAVLDLCREVGRIVRGIERGLARSAEP